MVREANVKQANAEKQLKEAQGKVRVNRVEAFIVIILSEKHMDKEN